jgi:hypothetical protein
MWLCMHDAQLAVGSSRCAQLALAQHTDMLPALHGRLTACMPAPPDRLPLTCCLSVCPACHPLQIFTERPEVHRAYLEHVPHNMDEKAFWTRYLKQQYKCMARRYVGLPGGLIAGLGGFDMAAGS